MSRPPDDDGDPPVARSSWRPLALLALVAYLPLVLTRPGWVSADTKTYLYLDPGRLLGRAWSMWDPGVGLGTVTHQSVGYLWPMGPWYWAFDALGVPDWLAQRLWWGTILFAAGAGVAYLIRRFEWPSYALWPAVFVYALSPYTLSLMGRLSGVLLPFAGLPWLLAFTIQSVRHKGWRYPALFALTVATVGSVNLTALLLVGVAPLLWLVHIAFVTHEASLRRVLATAGRLALITLPVNAWWLAGLSVQATNGIDVVRYSETAEAVTLASSAQELMRGLGNWIFYGGDKIDLWIEPSPSYTERPWLLIVTFAVPVLALLGAAVARWPHRSFAIAMVGAGLFLSVGAHPWSSPPPLGRVFRAFLGSERGLAFRSLPRAAPLIALGLALLLGAGVAAVAARRPRLAGGLALGIPLLALLGLPWLWQGQVVAENLSREGIPEYWQEAAEAADRRDDGTRVLGLPGTDFAYYRWGVTIDPISPGLMDRPYAARERIPYGSPPAADLLNALDLRLQDRIIDPAALAPMARFLRAGDLMLRNDLQYERSKTPNPRLVWDLARRAPGLGEPIPFGRPVPNETIPEIQLQDESWLVEQRDLPHPPPVALVPVAGAPDIVSVQPASGAVLLAGDGAGLVDAASAGLLDGTELVRYSATLTEEEVAQELDRGAVLVLTDTNRKSGERWGTIRQTRGYTEPADQQPLEEDLSDHRLPKFANTSPDTQTVAEHRGGLTANATSYGNPIAFAGEERPVAAVDGDPTTAWKTANFTDARGERLVITLDEPRSVDRIRLVQPIDGDSNRSLTEVNLSIDGREPIRVALDQTSRSLPGQLVTFEGVTASRFEIELVADTAGDRPRFGGVGPVGFAEVRIDDDEALAVDELIRLPEDLLAAAGAAGADRPLAVLLTRIRQNPTDATRDDEERSMVRTFKLPTPRTLDVEGTVRLSGRAGDQILDRLLGQTSPGVSVSGSERLTGSRIERAAAAFDGDLRTAWTSRRDHPTDVGLVAELAEPTTIEHLSLDIVTDGRHSVPTELEVLVDGEVVDRPSLPALSDQDDFGATTATEVPLTPVTGRRFEVRVTDAREITSIDWDSLEAVPHPVAIAELALPGARLPAPVPTIDTGCRDDLLEVDGAPLPVRVTGSTEDALAGRALHLEGCEPASVEGGDHELRTAPGLRTGLDLDQLVLTDLPATGVTTPETASRATVVEERADRVEVRVEGRSEAEPTWLVLGQSFNDGWSASLDGDDLGPPRLVDGFANGWELPPGTDPATVELRFEPQKRVFAALALSGVSAVLALVLLVRRPRRLLPAVTSAAPRPLSLADSLRYGGPLPSWRATIVVAATVALGAALVVHPLVALALGAAAVLACRRESSRRWLTLLPPLLFGAAALYVVAWQVRHRIPPGLEWPGEVERAHPIAVLAVVVLLAEAAIDRAWSSRRPERGTHTGGPAPDS